MAPELDDEKTDGTPAEYSLQEMSGWSEGGSSSSNESTSESTSSSWSSVPDWALSYVQGLTGDYGSYGWDQYTQSMNDLANAGDYTEQYRQALNSQYQADILQPTMDAVYGAINTAAGQGVMSSSITESMVNAAAEEALASAAAQQTASNVWAAEQNIENLETSAAAWGEYNQALKDYLGLTEVSTSASGSESTSSGTSSSSSYSQGEMPDYLYPEIPGEGDGTSGVNAAENTGSYGVYHGQEGSGAFAGLVWDMNVERWVPPEELTPQQSDSGG